MATSDYARKLFADGLIEMVEWNELDTYVPRVEKTGLDHILHIEGVDIKVEQPEMIWE